MNKIYLTPVSKRIIRNIIPVVFLIWLVSTHSLNGSYSERNTMLSLSLVNIVLFALFNYDLITKSFKQP